jgi:putative protease
VFGRPWGQTSYPVTGVVVDEIREIRQQSSIELESFVHGSICISYSGPLYQQFSDLAMRTECTNPPVEYTLTPGTFPLRMNAAYIMSSKISV